MAKLKQNFSKIDADQLPTVKALTVSTEELLDGCYVVRWIDAEFGLLMGSLRVSRLCNVCFVSGDIYRRDQDDIPELFPAFPREDCYFYFAAQSIRSGTFGGGYKCLKIVIERSKFSFPEIRDPKKSVWLKGGKMTMLLVSRDADQCRDVVCYDGYAVEGDVSDEVVVMKPHARASVSIERYDSCLRKATIDVVLKVNINEIGLRTLRGLVDQISLQIKWNIDFRFQESAVPLDAKVWKKSDLRAAMVKFRDSFTVDDTFRYAAFLVNELAGGYYGLMFDSDAVDGDLLPREAFAVSCGAPLGAGSGIRIDAQNQALCLVAEAFKHVVAHEFGHVLGVCHDKSDTYFMRQTDYIIGDQTNREYPFPGNVKPVYVDLDVIFFQHAPDWLVRSGGERFVHEFSGDSIHANIGSQSVTPISEGIEFSACPVLSKFPLGAPVRLDLCITFTSATTEFRLPKRLSLSAGNVRGWVTDSDGVKHPFRPLLRCAMGGSSTYSEIQAPQAGRQSAGSVTLLRGRDGALFPKAGRYKVELETFLHAGGGSCCLIADAWVCVTEATSELHKKAAETLFKTPEVFLVVALGQLRSRRGVEALTQALQCDDLLRHYAWTEAKRLYRLAHKSRVGGPRYKELVKRYRRFLETKQLVLTHDEKRKLEMFKALLIPS